MSVAKVSLSIDEQALAEARDRAGARGLSAYISSALQRQLQHDRVAELLAEMEAANGPVDPAALEKARRVWLDDDD